MDDYLCGSHIPVERYLHNEDQADKVQASANIVAHPTASTAMMSQVEAQEPANDAIEREALEGPTRHLLARVRTAKAGVIVL